MTDEMKIGLKATQPHRLFPGYDGDEAGEVRARVDGTLFFADWSHDRGQVRIVTPSGLAASEPRDPEKGTCEEQARTMVVALVERIKKRQAGPHP